jgi:hypothetical protein
VWRGGVEVKICWLAAELKEQGKEQVIVWRRLNEKRRSRRLSSSKNSSLDENGRRKEKWQWKYLLLLNSAGEEAGICNSPSSTCRTILSTYLNHGGALNEDVLHLVCIV